jgi:tetratricopeptide (TPR) repeat protein
MREKIYPKLRTVSFDFHLHRIDMVQDTVWTTELDTVYMDGLQAIRDLDYKKAVTLLRPYGDYNAALAFLCADYNHSAMDILNRLDDTDPRVCYMKSLVLARLRQYSESLKYYELAIAYDPAFEFRANLDPEMHEIVKLRYKENETDYNIEDYDSALYSGRMHGAGGQN